MSYQAPLEELSFLVNELVDLTAVADPDLISAELAVSIWDEASRFASGVLAPLDQTGDRAGLKFEQGKVTTPEGFKDAYTQLIAGGWNNVAIAESNGGQGLPWVISTPVTEMFSSANKAFNMCPGLTSGAIEALQHSGSDELKQRFLGKLVSGEWTGTMNITEPQAGTDVGAIRTKAVHQDDGTYLISGQKIFISFGEHDMAENIVHLVLARLPDAPAGVKGISLFLVPKFLVNEDGSIGQHNDLACVSIEHKLGIHASPTCTLSFGDQGGATGYLVGEENKGLACMFVMMNSARLAVGVEGLASAEAAFQKARSYAYERVQGASMANPADRVVIAEHEDVRRMLLVMQSRIRAMRAMALVIAEAKDLSEQTEDAATRAEHERFLSILTPVFKAWATESGTEVASLAIQIHGGMGYMEETGVAQIWRDSRINSIYEGTSGIQAADLVNRKLLRDQGQGMSALIQRIRLEMAQWDLPTRLQKPQIQLSTSVELMEKSAKLMLQTAPEKISSIQFVSLPFLMLCGHVLGGWLTLKCANRICAQMQSGVYSAKFSESWLCSSEFYTAFTLADTQGYYQLIESYLEGNTPVPSSEVLQPA